MSNIIDYIPFVMFSICDFKKMSVLEGKVTQNVSGSTDVTRTVSGFFFFNRIYPSRHIGVFLLCLH